MPRRKRGQKPKPRRITIEEAVGEAFGEFRELADELQAWADSMPENLQGSSKHDQVTEAADALEQIADDAPTVDESLAEVTVEIQDLTPRSRAYSRANRYLHAIDVIYCVTTRLEEDGGESAAALAAELTRAREEAESVPGMIT
jgi:hypothetical protein